MSFNVITREIELENSSMGYQLGRALAMPLALPLLTIMANDPSIMAAKKDKKRTTTRTESWEAEDYYENNNWTLGTNSACSNGKYMSASTYQDSGISYKIKNDSEITLKTVKVVAYFSKEQGTVGKLLFSPDYKKEEQLGTIDTSKNDDGWKEVTAFSGNKKISGNFWLAVNVDRKQPTKYLQIDKFTITYEIRETDATT